MSISISGSSGAAGDAADSAVLAAGVQRASIGAEIVSKTLDALNQQGGASGSGSAMAADYDFQKSVLSAAYGVKGVVADLNG